jgi:hypothetical protein
MRAVVERETVATEFQHRLQDLKDLEARIAATDERIAVIREVIRGFGCRSVAQALEGPPPGNDSNAPHPSDSPAAGGAGLLPWVFVVALATFPILFIPFGNLKPSASNNRPPDARWVSSEPATTAISPRDTPQALPDIPDAGGGLRPPEPSTDAPSQEATTSMAIRSTLPPSEDDLVPGVAALSSPPIATPDTVDTTTALPTPLLDLGQVEDAKFVQRRLIDLGFLFATANGNWGPRSRKALRDFRSAQDLGNNDIWDKTQQDLFSATAARASVTGTFVGGWGINTEQCRQAADNRSPLTISTRRAEAFSTTCLFNSTQREGASEWRIQATCADEHDRWNANIRLTLAGNRLTWASERGTATYLRCPVIWN